VGNGRLWIELVQVYAEPAQVDLRGVSHVHAHGCLLGSNNRRWPPSNA